MSKKSEERRRSERERKFSALAQHRQEGKKLLPPFARLQRLAFTSWMNDRLPEMLWGALLVGNLSRPHALDLFRRAVKTLQSQRGKNDPLDVTLTALATMDEKVANEFLNAVAGDPDATAILSGLLLFKALPGRERWARAVRGDTARVGWDAVARAVALCLDHQSQEATDVRWVRWVSQVVAGRMMFAAGMEDHVRELVEYPNVGDMRNVRPSIRAAESTMDAAAQIRGDPRSPWVDSFWSECMASTPCDPLNGRPPPVPAAGTTVSQVDSVRAAIERHLVATRTTTAVDARHDAAFGMVLYGLDVLGELLRVGNATSILGRAGLRTILETFLTLAFLAKTDDPKLWTTFRQYGAAQAKLAFLKLDASGARPSSISMEAVEALANEDLWQEYLAIDLGQWAGSDLRKMSERAGEKAHYDKYYSWTSGFVHGNWAAVRNAVFTTCINPLHRLHRIPRGGGVALEDVVPDAVELCDAMLGLLARLYPPLGLKLSVTP